MLEGHDFEFARTVDEDLSYLMDEWVPKLDRAELRRTSPILRRLLVQGDYHRAWRLLELPGEPSVSAPTIDAMLGTIDRSLIQIALVPPGQTMRNIFHNQGDVKIHVKPIAPVEAGGTALVIPGYQDGLATILAILPPVPAISIETPDDVVQREIHAKFGRRIARGQPLNEYLASAAALVGGVTISRQDVIQYVANKVGGVHSDSRRQGAQGARFKLLDRPVAIIEVGGRKTNFAFAELLSIGEFLAESGDADRYRRAFRKADRDQPDNARD